MVNATCVDLNRADFILYFWNEFCILFRFASKFLNAYDGQEYNARIANVATIVILLVDKFYEYKK